MKKWKDIFTKIILTAWETPDINRRTHLVLIKPEINELMQSSGMYPSKGPPLTDEDKRFVNELRFAGMIFGFNMFINEKITEDFKFVEGKEYLGEIIRSKEYLGEIIREYLDER